MKTISIPKFFHELFGEEQNPIELALVIIFTVSVTTTAAAVTVTEWQRYAWYQLVVLVLLYLDISGGVIANLTFSTNRYYQNRPTSRIVFIAIHVQPLIAAFVLNTGYAACTAVWAYTVAGAFIVNSLNHPSIQRIIAVFLMTLGILGLTLFGRETPLIITALLILYIIKVVFSFAVNHYKNGE